MDRMPLIDKRLDDLFGPTRPTRWVTRERPKIDRIACPWLIRRFIDSEARFFYVPATEVLTVAASQGAVAMKATVSHKPGFIWGMSAQVRRSTG